MVLGFQRHRIQHVYCQTRDWSYGWDDSIVRPCLYIRFYHWFPYRGTWKTSTYKKYNFDAEGVPSNGGALHPLLKVREEFRSIFLEMGWVLLNTKPWLYLAKSGHSFAEMPTSQFVESGFWNFDTLFVPQQHPARDLQDTFYISDPAVSKPPPKEYYDKVSAVHSVRSSFLSFSLFDNWSGRRLRFNRL